MGNIIDFLWAFDAPDDQEVGPIEPQNNIKTQTLNDLELIKELKGTAEPITYSKNYLEVLNAHKYWVRSESGVILE